ncbi:hypothetical protein ACWGM0_10605 [Sphingomonas bisphenolicum]
MPDIEAILTKPLDGDPIGATRTFSQTDFNELKDKGAVIAAADASKKPAAQNPAKDA